MISQTGGVPRNPQKPLPPPKNNPGKVVVDEDDMTVIVLEDGITAIALE